MVVHRTYTSLQKEEIEANKFTVQHLISQKHMQAKINASISRANANLKNLQAETKYWELISQL